MSTAVGEMSAEVTDEQAENGQVVRIPHVSLAAAVAGILCLVGGIHHFGCADSGSVTWDEIFSRVDSARDVIYRLRMSTATGPELHMIQYRSARLGVRQNFYQSKELRAVRVINPAEQVLHALDVASRTYSRRELSDAELGQLRGSGDVREFIERFRSLGYRPIGTGELNGIAVSAIETEDPEIWGERFESGRRRLWIDMETKWPLRLEYEGSRDDGAARVEYVLDGFHWNPDLPADEFEFRVPPGFSRVTDPPE